MNFNFTFEEPITKELLLSRHNEEVYMEYYLGIQVKKGLFRNPLRGDKNPTASFYRDKRGNLIFKDFGNGFSGNFISVVMEKFQCTYHHALKIIANDFNIRKCDIKKTPGKINLNAKIFVEKETTKIQIEIKDFTKSELDWWKEYGITEKTLKKFRVFSCKNIFLNDNLHTMVTAPNMVFGYYGGKIDGLELWRCYFPRRKEYRFLSNWPAKKIQGFEMLPSEGKLLVITKSMKDVMCLFEYGVPAIAPNSETLFLTESVLNQMKQRFKYIVVLYDNDIPGINGMRKIKKNHSELIYTWIPRGTSKDISDYRKKFGAVKTKELLIRFVKWLEKSKS